MSALEREVVDGCTPCLGTVTVRSSRNPCSGISAGFAPDVLRFVGGDLWPNRVPGVAGLPLLPVRAVRPF
jgi:hypothetical protein